jgi:hypothetical protein
MNKHVWTNAGLTKEEIEAMDIDYSMVSACKQIRHLATLDKFQMVETESKPEFLKYLHYCKKSEHKLVHECLQNLQPYMIEPQQDDSFFCSIPACPEFLVRIAEDKLYVTMCNGRTNPFSPKAHHEYVPVFADCIQSESIYGIKDQYNIKLLIQQGMMAVPVFVTGTRHGEIFLVKPRDIKENLETLCSNHILDLYALDLGLDYDSVNALTVLEQMPFRAYSRDTFSSVNLLVENLAIQRTPSGRQSADMTLVTFVQGLRLTPEQQEELLGLLEEAHVKDNWEGMDLILARVRENLCFAWNQKTSQIEMAEEQKNSKETQEDMEADELDQSL